MKHFGPILLFTLTASLSVADNHFSRNNADFATNLYQKSIEEYDNENIIVSPISIQTAIGLAFIGANGPVAEEIVYGLGLTSFNKHEVSQQFNEILNKHYFNQDITIANKIYGNISYTIRRCFQEIAYNRFYSNIDYLNFVQTQEAVGIINNWVENVTNHHIKDIVEPSMLDQDTLMVLINAVFFQASWLDSFNKQLTYIGNFWTNHYESVQMPMMSSNMKLWSKYSNILKATAIKLPYQQSGLYMMIFLPDDKDGLRHLEECLNHINLFDFADNMKEIEFDDISIPKFKIETNIKLNDILSKMGMRTMFSHWADFSEMIESDQPIRISKAFHKTFIDVNEEGTLAETSTAMKLMVMCDSCDHDPIVFNADHPFFFTIMDEDSILFIGRFIKP